MKVSRAIGAGAVAGVAAGAVLALAARLLGLDLAPWRWLVPADDSLLAGQGTTLAVLVPVLAAAGAGTALAHALVFEYVTRRAGWLIGGAVGVLQGILAAAVIGLVPWAAERMTHASALTAAPFGIAHSTVALIVLVLPGIVFGAIVGAFYGAPRHSAETLTEVWWREVYPTTRRFP